MSNANFHRALKRRGIAFAIVAAIGFPMHTAAAQLGGLVKKARDKVVENQVEKQIDKRVGTAPPKFDDVTLELSADRLGQVIRGLTAGRAVLADRQGLVAQRDAAAQKSADLHDKNNKLISDHTDKRYANERCRNDAMNASREKRSGAADPEPPAS